MLHDCYARDFSLAKQSRMKCDKLLSLLNFERPRENAPEKLSE